MKDKHVLYAIEQGYRVTEDGRVLSPAGVERRLTRSSDGYLRFSVKNKDRGIDGACMVHRLAAAQWFGLEAFQPGFEVRHLDGKRDNNRKDNISIGTHQRNMLDRPPEDRLAHAKKAASSVRRFTEQQVAAIREDRERGMSLKSLMAKYGGAKSTISYIVNGKMYADSSMGS